jgi:fructosamine-3-kinase
MITPGLQTEIEKEMGGRLLALAPLSAANNAQIYRIAMDGGRVFVVKVAERGLDIEAFMLGYLAEKTRLPVPRVHYSNEHVIVMDFIDAHYSQDSRAARHAAELLAELHGIRAERYGFGQDTLIGALRQPNPPTDDWVAFFAEHRLLYMARLALEEGKIDAKMMKQAENLAGRLNAYIGNPGPPSLVHGDVWSGNVLSGRGKIAAFLDPAIYFADAEIELAFIHLFNTFDESFFDRYNDLRPIAPGFAERADIYNIYPLLVHTRLFGASYARKAQKLLDRYA